MADQARLPAELRRATASGEESPSRAFEHLGLTLALLRSLRGKQQAEVARAAGLGKSQLSKYEGGRELPRLDSLARLLRALDVNYLDFACTLALVQNRAKRLASSTEGDDCVGLLCRAGFLSEPTAEPFNDVVRSLLRLHRQLFEALLSRNA